MFVSDLRLRCCDQDLYLIEYLSNLEKDIDVCVILNSKFGKTDVTILENNISSEILYLNIDDFTDSLFTSTMNTMFFGKATYFMLFDDIGELYSSGFFTGQCFDIAGF